MASMEARREALSLRSPKNINWLLKLFSAAVFFYGFVITDRFDYLTALYACNIYKNGGVLIVPHVNH